MNILDNDIIYIMNIEKYGKNIDNKKINIATFGTFDLLHIGHINIFQSAYDLKDNVKLFVGVSSDRWNSLKGKVSHQSQQERIEAIKSKYPNAEVFLEDHAKPEETWPMLWDRYDIDLIVMGGDHQRNLDYINRIITPKGRKMKIIFFDRTQGISSTKLRGEIENNK